MLANKVSINVLYLGYATRARAYESTKQIWATFCHVIQAQLYR